MKDQAPSIKDNSYFAPALRSTSEEIISDNQLINFQKEFLRAFNSMVGVSAILNANRQIVYSNSELLELLGVDSIESILGKRPGEAISCLYSPEEPYGCGTTRFCGYCGAVNAIMESQRTNKKTVKETRIISIIKGKMVSWDLSITSIPITLSGKVFYILTLKDISDEKRRAALERIFFHDLLNSVGGLNGLLSILKEVEDPAERDEIINISEEVTRDIIEEIVMHRQIKAAESGDLQVNIDSIDSREFLTSTINKISSHSVGKNRDVILDPTTPDFNFETDRILLSRVIINLLKNALEATDENGSVSVGAEDTGDTVKFWVKNDKVIPIYVQAQLFQRSFSTKDSSRGIGTYSVKLLTENYLKGKVSFVSNETDKTVFSVELNKKWPEEATTTKNNPE